MFTFTKSNGFKVNVSLSQKHFLSSDYVINSAIQNKEVLAFDIFYDEVLIGFAMFKQFAEHKYFMWDYAIDVKYQNQGFGFNALCELLKYLASNYEADTVTTTYIYDNKHAKYIYEKIGFKEVSVVENKQNKEINMILKLKSQV